MIIDLVDLDADGECCFSWYLSLRICLISGWSSKHLAFRPQS